MTTALNLSRSSGYRLNDDCDVEQARSAFLILKVSTCDAHRLDQKLTQDPDQLVIHQLTTSQGGFLQSSDLLLDDDLERSSADKEGGGRTLNFVIHTIGRKYPLPKPVRADRLTAELYKIVLISPSLF